MEIIGLVILGLGVLEGLVLCIEMHNRNRLLKFNNALIDTINKAQEIEKKTRRDVDGTFQNPLGDTYRKNTRHQYVPIKPGSKMLDGDEEE